MAADTPQICKLPADELVMPGTQTGLSQWRLPALLLGLGLLAIFALYGQTVLSIGERWYGSRTYSHGFLILPLALYLAWNRRRQLSAVVWVPNFWGLLPLTGSSLVWLAAYAGDVRVLQQFAVVGLVWSMVFTVMGASFARVLWFPLAFLIFAVPFGDTLTIPLQNYTAWFSVAMLRLVGIPVLLEGHLIWVPSGSWEVAEACSGVRYLISSFVLGVVYASITYRSRWRQLIFLIASVLVPILANGLRAFGIILLAHFTNNRLAVGVDHIIYGWAFFAAVEFLVIWVGWKFRDDDGPVRAAQVLRKPIAGATRGPALAALTVVAVLLAGIAPVMARRLDRIPSARMVSLEPSVMPPWRLVYGQDASWVPDLHAAEAEVCRTYAKGDRLVYFHVAGYWNRDHRLETVQAYNSVRGSGWSSDSIAYRDAIIAGQHVKVRQSLLRSQVGTRIVWSWYVVADRVTSDPYRVKLEYAQARLLGKATAGEVISIATNYEPGMSERTLQEFLAHASVPGPVIHTGR